LCAPGLFFGSDLLPAGDDVDRETLLQHLAVVGRHVAEAEQHVFRQRQIVAELERTDGKDAQTARELLGKLKALLAAHTADRDRLLKELEL
jgi:hypothetical protein